MTTWPDGYDKVILDTVDSTNEEAQRRSARCDVPLWIMAHRQTAGRGRRGRVWEDAAGNLYATLLIKRHTTPSEAARLSFHASLAVADTVRVFAAEANISVKWPNDVLVDGNKIAGILLETLQPLEPAQVTLAIGIGLNLSGTPGLVAPNVNPISLRDAGGQVPDPETALAVLARRLDHWLQVEAASGFSAVREAWLRRAQGLGSLIDVRLPDRTLCGTFSDVDADGLLVLETAGGVRTIAAGDVFFRRPS